MLDFLKPITDMLENDMPKRGSRRDDTDDLRKSNHGLRMALADLLMKLGLYTEEGELTDEYLIDQAGRYDPRAVITEDSDEERWDCYKKPDDDEIPF
jgi:hypothetical protein